MILRAAKQTVKLLLLSAIFIGLAVVPCEAATKYLRAAATGNGTGLDWTNAYTSLAALESGLARGDTGYVASGTYTGATFDTALADSQYITIKKATDGDHGTITGWVDNSATHGLGQATLGSLSINVGFIKLDGQYAYGFKINVPDGGTGILIGGSNPSPRDGITLRYIDIAGIHGDVPHNFQTDTRCIQGNTYFNTGTSTNPIHNFAFVKNLLVEYCNLHAVSTLVQIDQFVNRDASNNILDNNITFQYNKFHDNKEAAGYNSSMAHQNMVYATNTRRIIFRYNEVWNTTAVGFYPSYTGGYHEIYGNVVYNSSSFVWIFEQGSQPGIKYYNNTLSGVSNPYMDQSNLSSGTITNNIFHNSGSLDLHSTLTHDYNWYSGSSKNGEVNGFAGGAIVDPFVSLATKNFKIGSTVSANHPRDKGSSIFTPTQCEPVSSEPLGFCKDPDNTIRGKSDGKWDIGAFEFNGAAAAAPAAPSNLRIN